MNKRVKKGLTLMLLGAAYFSHYLPNVYSRETPAAYSQEDSSTSQKPENHRENEGFSSEGLVYAGLITLGAYYILKRALGSRKKQ